MLNVLIADDHPLFREGLKKLIDEQTGFEVIACSGNGIETIQLLRTLLPDIAFLDIHLPGKSGLEIVSSANQNKLPTRFIILTMYDDKEYFEAAMELGIKGYLLKENDSIEVVKCLRAVRNGEIFVSPRFFPLLAVNNHSSANHVVDSNINSLTRQEWKILKKVAENKTSRQIASELFISLRTVQKHRNNICHKLNLQGSHRLLEFALDHKDLFSIEK